MAAASAARARAPRAVARPAATIPVAGNLALCGAVAALNLTQFFALPLLLLPVSRDFAWLLVATTLSAPTHWSLIHEAIHGVAHPARRVNDALGRALSVLFGSPFQLLRLGHLMHHRFNRSELNRVEVAPPSEKVGLWRRVGYYSRLLGGLYVGELLAAPLAMAPKPFSRLIILAAFDQEASDGRTMRAAARRQLLEEPGRSRMRLDGALITAMLAASFIAYGADWPLLLAALAGRAAIISFFDNVYHYGAPLDDVMAGRDLRAPGWMRRALLNFNYHATHHRAPSAPWTALSRLAETPREPFWPAALEQLRGPLPEHLVPLGPADRRGADVPRPKPPRIEPAERSGQPQR